MIAWVEQWICIKIFIKIQHSSMWTIHVIQKAKAMGNCWLAASSWQCTHSCITCCILHHIMHIFWWNVKSPKWLSTPPLYSPDLVPCNFWLFPKLKSPLKGKRFQTIDEIQENMMGQLMVTGRTMWGPKMPTLKGTEASLSYVQCFLYLESSSINVSIFHIAWLVYSGTKA